MLRFARANARWLAGGGVLTFGSAFGQTYFISVFGEEIRAAFFLSHSAWASAYMTGTLASAGAMLLLGGLADRWPAPRLALTILAGLSLACLAMAALPGGWLLPVTIFALRFFGQGMSVHLAMVLAGRWFVAARGRAVSIITLGLPISEALLPFAFVQIMLLTGWRGAWAVAALLPLALMIPAALLLRQPRVPQGKEAEAPTTGMDARHWTRGQALSHWFFWLILPGTLTLPIFGTAFIFQQTHLIEVKGWSLSTYFALFPLLPASSVLWLFVGGWAVDRFGAGAVLTAAHLPFAVGLTVFALATPVWAGVFGFLAFGMMLGFAGASLGTLWPEYYGTLHLGAIRSTAASIMVFGTALGPVITGALIDQGIAYEDQLIGIALYTLVIGGLTALAARHGRTHVPLAVP